jgi:glycosyltransferase involved in cell wall biosynthesis
LKVFTKEDVEAIRASGLFDADWYLATYPDVAAQGMDPVEHYLWLGARLRRNPSPTFETAGYLDMNGDVAATGVNPLLHYVKWGKGGRRMTGDILPGRSWHQGKKKVLSHAPSIMLCAHQVNEQLFGGERSFLDVLEALAQLQVNVFVTLPRNNEHGYLDIVRENSCGVYVFPYAQWQERQRLNENIVSDFCDIIDRHDISLVYVNTIVLREPQIAARRMGRLNLVHARELIDQDDSLCKDIGLGPADVVRAVLDRSDYVVANSQATEQLFFRKGKTFCIPNIVDLEQLNLGNEPEQIIKFGIVSSNIPKKGVFDFVEVAKLCQAMAPKARFVMIGPDNAYIQDLKAQNIPQNLIFAGYAPSPREAMSQANVILSLSHFGESFGRTCAEALAARRPVVAYKWGALSEMIEHGVTGFLTPHKDIRAVAEYVTKLSNEPKLIREMGEAGRLKVTQRNSPINLRNSLSKALSVILDQSIYFREGPAPRLTVIVPVYNAHDTVRRCLQSISLYTDLSTVKVLIINDGSSEPEIAPLLAEYARQDGFRVVTNSVNIGYTKTINKGIKLSDEDDVIILNSDTIVTREWVEGIQLLARRAPDIGTVTAMSDNAGAFSFPVAHQPNPKPNHVSHETWAETILKATKNCKPVEVPTGSGFCMYVRRDLIGHIGLFDEDAFPRGYGEENDFCMRALNAGWRNLISPYSFVFHERTASFGKEKEQLIENAIATISRKYPDYSTRVKIAFASEEIKELRRRAESAYGGENHSSVYAADIADIKGSPSKSKMNSMSTSASGSVATMKARHDDRRLSIGRSSTSVDAESLAGIFPQAARDSVFCQKLTGLLSSAISVDLVEALRRSEAALENVPAQLEQHKQHPLVSVIMPTFNRAEIVGEAIQSIIDQDYINWELFVCDDGSTDDTESVVGRFNDARIRYCKLNRGGAAAARNVGLARTSGDMVAYLDSDNHWHPRFLSRMVLALLQQPGRSAAYSNYIDYNVYGTGGVIIKSFTRPEFSQEKLLEKNYIDLNSFVHRRELYDCWGGFNESLTRRQDYDLVLKYTWLRDPLYVEEILTLYQRNENFSQITTAAGHDNSCVSIINESIESYLKKGLPLHGARPVKSVTILSWDLCRNHFSKPFALAEALSADYDVQLISFRFFEEEIFPPLKGVDPSFETIYLPGSGFPHFFETMERAVEAVRGEVVYVVKPRLPSLGVALLANQRHKVPIILEINDLETVVSSPKSEDRHTELSLDSVDLADKNLLNPYSDLWSQLMDPIAKELPVLVTHNGNLDAHFGNRCLYMRNLKDEAVYSPASYDRDKVRAELGFGPDDRVILFGGLIRKHKGIYELVELVERLGDTRYKLLFVGSRPTPDQKQLMDKYGERVRVLPPQDREAMARINFAADLVILWLDPDVPASHYQMPYKATDAFAMGPIVVANDISDLGVLGKQGYLHLVPFGDWSKMTAVIDNIFKDARKRQAMRAASRRLFLRQFSYPAARSNFALATRRALAHSSEVLPTAEVFARHFEAFRRKVKGEASALSVGIATQLSQPSALQTSVGQEDKSIVVVDVKNADGLSWSDPHGVAVVMPSIDVAKALDTARLLVKRAGMATRIFVVEDTLRQGFIKTLNQAAARLDVRYVVYLAEDAFPGVDWLKLAYDQLEETGKGLLAFNCGKWRGRVAAFGMVRKVWVKSLYGGPVLFSSYKAHRADNELTAIARAVDQFVYCPDAVLVELDARKAFRVAESDASNFTMDDKRLFIDRFNNGFGGLVKQSNLIPFRDEYLNQRKLALMKAN